MKDWQKLLLDPAAHTTLRQLDTEKKKQELVEKTGIKTPRMEKLLEKLEEHGLVEQVLEKGERTYHLSISYDRIKQLRLEIEDHTTLEVENMVKAGNFHEARKQIHRDPPMENIHKRRTVAKIEALEKLEQLPKTSREDVQQGPWQSLKGFIPRF